MKWLIALLLTCSSVLGQGFGSFTYDQPFLAGSSALPGIPPVLSMWWRHGDISSNNPVSTWNDSILGYPLIQTNSIFQPTNAADGVCFDGTKSLEFSPSVAIPAVCSIYVSGFFSKIPHNQIVLYSTNGNEGLFINATNQIVSRRSGADRGFSSVMNATNFATFALTQTNIGGNISLVTYMNGAQVGSNWFAGTATTFDLVGGWSSRAVGQTWGWLDYSLYGYITDIMLWTNQVLSVNNIIYLDAASRMTNSATKTPFFDPSSVSTPVHWVRADDPSSGQGAGGPHTNTTFITFMPDSVNWNADSNRRYGNGSAATPRLMQTGGPGGLPTMSINTSGGPTSYGLGWDGSNDGVNQPVTIFVLYQFTNTATCFFTQQGATAFNIHQLSPSTLELNAGTPVNTTWSPTTAAALLTVGFNTNTSWFRTNRVVAGSNINIGTDQLNDMSFGAAASFNQLQGYISEWLVYSGSMSTNEIQTVENYLANKYGTP